MKCIIHSVLWMCSFFGCTEIFYKIKVDKYEGSFEQFFPFTGMALLRRITIVPPATGYEAILRSRISCKYIFFPWCCPASGQWETDFGHYGQLRWFYVVHKCIVCTLVHAHIKTYVSHENAWILHNLVQSQPVTQDSESERHQDVKIYYRTYVWNAAHSVSRGVDPSFMTVSKERSAVLRPTNAGEYTLCGLWVPWNHVYMWHNKFWHNSPIVPPAQVCFSGHPWVSERQGIITLCIVISFNMLGTCRAHLW